MDIPSRIPPKSGTHPAGVTIAKHKDFAGDPVTFRKPPGAGTEVVDEIGPGLTIARDDNGAIFNIVEENDWNSNNSPVGTEWNADGWENLHQVKQRYYTNFYDVLDEAIGENIINSNLSKLVMHDTINDKYYKVQFHFWQAGGDASQNGGFSYTRQEIFLPETVNFVYAGYENPGDEISEHVTIVRGEYGGIYNSVSEEQWDFDKSPAGTLWNTEGWDDLTNVTLREYHPLYAVTGYLGDNIQEKDYVMYDVAANEYYKVKFSHWQGGGGGAFTYDRTKINHWAAPEGIRFGDGSLQTNAAGEGLNMVKAEYWGYPDNTVQIKNAQDNDAIALASTSTAIVRWQAREQAAPVTIESWTERNDVGGGDWHITFNVDPDRVMLPDYVYTVYDATNSDFNGEWLSVSGGTGTVTLLYDFDPTDGGSLPADGFIGGPSKYSQVQADDNGVYIKTAQWDPDETHQYFWTFLHDGGLEFPDGSVQTTAYIAP